ncbi:MAG: arrestin family protein [Planctomycetota bacterium]|nr:arrestin family protein [Planctomycetota bacterium]
MANMESAELVINLPHPGAGSFPEELVRGEPMRVPIVLQLDTPRRVRCISACFHGAQETKATYTTTTVGAKGQVTTQTHTAVETIDIVKQDWILAGHEPRGCIGNMFDAAATLLGGGRHQRMTPGEYQYEVEVVIPPDAMLTHQGKNTRVFYELSVRVDIALGRDMKASQSFIVLPLPREKVDVQPVKVCYPDDEGRGFWSSLLMPDVRMELSLQRDLARQGDTIEGSFRVETQKSLEVKGVKVRLIGHEHSEAQSHKDTHYFKGEPVAIHAPRLIAPSWSTDFSLPSEVEGPPTSKGTKFSIDWFVEITLDVPWAKDPKIRVPITLE